MATSTKDKGKAKADETGYKLQMSQQCRRPKDHQRRFLSWVEKNPEFKERKPTVEEVVHEFRHGELRGLVELNHEKAARRYWRSEAQYWLRHVEIVRIKVMTSEVITKPVVAYMPIKVERNGTIEEENYVPAQRVVEDRDLKYTVLERAHADFMAFLARYERYSEFMQVFQPVVKAYKDLQQQLNDAGLV